MTLFIITITAFFASLLTLFFGFGLGRRRMPVVAGKSGVKKVTIGII